MKKRIIYLDVLRSLSVFFVIMLHVSASVLKGPYDLKTFLLISNIFDSFSRWSIPVFFMISGAVILSPEYTYGSIKEFFIKRFSKLFFPFLFWSFAYGISLVIPFSFWGFKIYNLTWFQLLNIFIGGPGTFFHLWFFYAIFGLYLLAPFLRYFTKYAIDRDWKYLLCFWFITTPILTLIKSYGIVIFSDYYLSGYIGFFLLGYYLHKKDFVSRDKGWIFFLGFLGYIFTFLGTIKISWNSFLLNQSLYGYMSLNVIFMSIAVFVLVKSFNWEEKGEKLIAFFKLISRLSFGIYLIHPIFLLVMLYLNSKYVHLPAFSYIVLSSFFVSFLSAGSVFILQKSPYLRKIV